jgi:5'-phosphate synthase pdxT subunit
MRIGVLALQGDVAEHRNALRELGVEAHTVRSLAELDDVDALILPGGESTTIAHLLRTTGLDGELYTRLHDGMPAFGTCAGLVLLASSITDGREGQHGFGLLDVTIRRNGYGRQVASFETMCELEGVGPVPAVFIRAPRITQVGEGVQVLSALDMGDGPHAVVVKQGPVLGASFHPELTSDRTLHRLFLEMAASGAAPVPK